MNHINVPIKLKILHSNEEVANVLLETIYEIGASKIALISTKTPTHLITNMLEVFLFEKVEKLKTFQVVNASISYVNQLPLSDFELVVGIGGGKVIDTAKYAAHINNIPCISIPTTVSNDGICSPIAVLKDKGNKHKSLGAKIPVAMLVPLHLIKQSEEETIISGIGDLLSNITAIEDWKLANKETKERIDDYSVIVSETAAKNVLLEIQKYILLNKKKEQFLNENIEMIINSLALSGIAMEIAGTSRPASGAEHLISHAIDELFGGIKQHGIQVAFGTYIVRFIMSKLGYITNNQFEELRAVFRYLELPTTLTSMNITKDQLIKAIQCAPKTRENRYTVLNKIKLDTETLDDVLDILFGPKSNFISEKSRF